MALKRREEREYAFTMLFEALFHKGESRQAVYESILENTDDPRIGKSEYIRRIFFGVAEKEEELLAQIRANAKSWKPERISKVSLSLLLLAIYEMLFVEEIPVKIAVNEAVELCKKYDDDKAPAFLNGVLRGVYRSMEQKDGEQ